VLFGLREEIRDGVHDEGDDSASPAASGARKLFSKGIAIPVAALAFASAGRFRRDSPRTETAQILLESGLWSTVYAAGGSFVLASERPRDGESVRLFSSSGHGVSLDVALAAALAAPIVRRYLRAGPETSRGRRAGLALARAGLYSGVALTALQRLQSDAHWAPDAFLGAAGGFGIGYALCDAHEPPRDRSAFLSPRAAELDAQARPRFIPLPGGVGVHWSLP
jgi:hypothetical protein